MEMTASAPGKLFVIGEYAVVGGGPAVVATVTRRLRARVRAGRGRGELVIRAGNGSVRCPLATDDVRELPAAARFVAGAALISARVLELAGVDVEVETESDLDPGTSKTGLGGSAAATAATVSAVHGLARQLAGGSDDVALRVATGVYAHRLAQGGGSAADVIAATVGGLVWVDGLDGEDVPHDVAASVARIRSARPIEFERLQLPPGLALEAVASGRSCATGPRVARFAKVLRGDVSSGAAAILRSWTDAMRAAAEMFRDACRAGDARLVVQAIRASGTLLSRLGAVAAIPVFTAELRRACAIAGQVTQTAAKPSGAGGGDCAIAVVAQDRRADLRRLWQEAGLEPLAVDVDPAGARVEVTT
jgi:phosphomevalonate kinase